MARSGNAAFVGALVATNLRASFALRGAFWAALVFMALNNLLFFTVWWIFFARFKEVRGWQLADVAALYGLVAAAFGIAVVFFGGVRDLARTIQDGELDALLTQPKSPLLHVVASRSWAAGWGDLLSGLGFLAYSGVVEPRNAPIAVAALGLSTVVFVATGVILHSGAFWLGRVDSLARQLWEFMITFSMYPSSIFQGAFKLLLFTVVPAGFIGHLPVSLLREFSVLGLAGAAAGALVYASLAVGVFHAGLRRYESGNRFGQR